MDLVSATLLALGFFIACVSIVALVALATGQKDITIQIVDILKETVKNLGKSSAKVFSEDQDQTQDHKLSK